MDEGALPPETPINPYLGTNVQKDLTTFNCLSIYAHFGSLRLELNMVPGVLLESYMSQGPGTPIVSKGLTNVLEVWEDFSEKVLSKELNQGSVDFKSLSPPT